MPFTMALPVTMRAVDIGTPNLFSCRFKHRASVHNADSAALRLDHADAPGIRHGHLAVWRKGPWNAVFRVRMQECLRVARIDFRDGCNTLLCFDTS